MSDFSSSNTSEPNPDAGNGDVLHRAPPPPATDFTVEKIKKKRAEPDRDPKRDEVLQRALERADRAMAMVDKMQEAVHRTSKRQSIEQSVHQHRNERYRSQQLLMAIFYGNFFVLGLIYMFGGGPVFDSAGNTLLTFARACGLTSTYLLLVQLLLVGRIPALDRMYGIDKMTRWHKLNGHISFDLALLHAYFAVMGRSLANQTSVGQAWNGVITLPFMVHAVIGTLLMTLAIATSIKNARRKIGFNRWHFVHLWTYLGVALSFGHQILGPDTLGRPGAQAYLWALYITTFGLLGYFRLAVPVINTFRHQLRVAKVVEEGPGVTSLYMKGLRLSELQAKPGQFCWWRFMTPRDWLEAHPFSISTAPNDKYVRITVKSLGDFSSRISQIPVGTWVTFEGPFGGFTPDRRTKYRTLLIAGGVGITPIRSLLEGLPTAPGDITVIYRADKVEDAVLLHELEELASQRHAILHIVLGSRSDYPADRQPMSPQHLRGLVPDIAHRDVFICASPGMTAAVRGTLKSMGLRNQQVHHETFD